MFNSTCDLGTIRLTFRREGLQMLAHAKTSFSGGFDETRPANDEASSVEHIWVRRGPPFAITFLLSNGSLPESLFLHVVHGLEKRLLEAEIWHQLGLFVTLDSGSERSTSEHIERRVINLLLTCRMDGAPMKGQENTNSASIDLRAPTGVPEATLKAVVFHLDLKPLHEHENPGKRRANDKKHDPIVGSIKDRQHNSSREPQDPLFEWKSNGPYESEQMIHSRNTLCMQEKDYNDLVQQAELDPALEAIVALVDAALRSFIIRRPVWISRSIQKNDDDILHPLSMLVPAIFSPGYITALQSRLILIPTLTRSLSGSFELTTSPIVQKHAANLMRFGELSEEENQRKLKSVVSQRLWLIAARELRDPESARILKPLNQSASTHNHHSKPPCTSQAKIGGLSNEAFENEFEETSLTEDHLAISNHDETGLHFPDFGVFGSEVEDARDSELLELPQTHILTPQLLSWVGYSTIDESSTNQFHESLMDEDDFNFSHSQDQQPEIELPIWQPDTPPEPMLSPSRSDISFMSLSISENGHGGPFGESLPPRREISSTQENYHEDMLLLAEHHLTSDSAVFEELSSTLEGRNWETDGVVNESRIPRSTQISDSLSSSPVDSMLME